LLWSNAEGIAEKSTAFEVTQPNKITLDIDKTDISCFGSKDGSFTTKIVGGSGSYEYRYADTNGYSNWTNTVADMVTIKDLDKGNYRLQVRDSNNCIALDSVNNSEFSVNILEPEQLQIVGSKVTNVSGFGLSNGAILVNVEGGTPGYKYQWLDANDAIIATGVNVISDIPAGNYTLIIEDSLECSTKKEYEVTEPEALEVTINPSSIISCSGGSNGSLKAIIKGGVGSPYSYKWYIQGSNTILGTESSLNNLGKGVYYVNVEDSESNMATSLKFELIEPTTLNLSLNSNFISCGTEEDWTVEAKVSGGRKPYSYLWNTKSNTSTIENVTPGFYEVIVIDASGCRITKSIELSPPEELSIKTEEIKNPICFGGENGSIFIEATGGVPPYDYNWNNGNSSSLNDGLKAGTHNLEIIDSKGCKIYRTYTLANPNGGELNLGDDITLCKNQTTALNATTQSGVKYNWTSSNGFSSFEPVIEVSEGGVYSVVVTNSQGCILKDEITITKSNDEISGDFLVSSVAFVNDPIVAVYVDNRLSNETEWLLPDSAIVNKSNDDYIEFYFEEAGEYEIILYSKKGSCEAYKTKSIFVTENEISDNSKTSKVSENNKPLIKEFTIYPNPNSGKFSLNLGLYKESEVSLKIFNLIHNEVIDYKKVSGKKEYVINYSLNVPSAVYFVLVQVENERLLKKLVIGK